MEFEGKVALVTGASTGIGRGVAKAFAEQGARVALCSRRESELEAVAKEIEAKGGKALVSRADVSSKKDVEAMFDKILGQWGRLDILVNSHGVYTTSSVVDMAEEEWDLTLDIDLKGVFLCSQAAARQMIKQGCGRIINISSTAQLRGGTKNHVHYGTAKGGVGAFTKGLAREIGEYGITVNCVAPGFIEDTEMGEANKAKQSESYQKRAIAAIPLRRYGRVADIVPGVLFLASDGASYITGDTLNINGGTQMP